MARYSVLGVPLFTLRLLLAVNTPDHVGQRVMGMPLSNYPKEPGWTCLWLLWQRNSKLIRPASPLVCEQKQESRTSASWSYHLW